MKDISQQVHLYGAHTIARGGRGRGQGKQNLVITSDLVIRNTVLESQAEDVLVA